MTAILTAAVAAAAVAGLTGPGAAQQIATLATPPAGAVPAMATAVARTVATHSAIQLRTQSMASETQYFPMVNAGQIEFGISNVFQAHFATHGTSIYEGRPHPNLRMAFTLLPFQFGTIVHKDSDLQTFAQLKGKRWATGFRTQRVGALMTDGLLANYGYGLADLDQVVVAGLPQMWDEFKRRRIDVSFIAIGSANAQEVAAAVGGVRYIPFDDSPEAVERMREVLPQSFIGEVTPPPTANETYPPVKTLRFDFVIWTSTHVPDETVYQVVKALYDHAGELRATGPMWRGFEAEYLAKDQRLEYHPGAVRFFTEKGLWRKPG